MAIRDIEAFLRECATQFDPNMDVTPGSPFDVQVIQRVVRRLGTDPFTVDLSTFINDRLVQAFPDLATKEGDAVTDLLNKPATLLWDPVVRENTRVRNNMSFKDPATLTKDEADALGSNFFINRRRGAFSRGVGRVFFSKPQDIAISPMNFFTSKAGLHFFPTEVQSIRTAEMLLNVTDGEQYYFDVNTIAEKAGIEYNIGPNELMSIANVPAAVRVTNLRRFGFGDTEETSEEFVGRAGQSLSERSMVALRGIAAKVLEAFPEVSRLNVVGFNDPEMQRDVIKGGGLGEILAAGTLGQSLDDGEAKALTRRFYTTELDFEATILGDPEGYVLTVFGAFGGATPARDLSITRIVGANQVDCEEQLMSLGATGLRWTLRKKELTLSTIPGGILFPNTAFGEMTVPDGEVHVGGCYDVHVRGSDFEESVLSIESISDDQPLLSGSDVQVISITGFVRFNSMSMGVTYEEGDETYQAIANAAKYGYTLQILEGPNSGNYRVTYANQQAGFPPVLTVTPAPPVVSVNTYRWRLLDEINIYLPEPKETRVTGDDLRTIQGQYVVDTVGGTNFDEFGVAQDDTLRILGGPDAGDYRVVADPLAPSYDKLQLDRPLTRSKADLDYLVFKPNPAGGAELPLVRIKTVEILDSSDQPIGSTIPYAKPVDIQSRAFQNPARGVKHDFRDARVGLVSQETTAGVFPTLSIGDVLQLLIDGSVYDVTFATAAPTVAQVVSTINATILGSTGIPEISVAVGGKRFGIRPVRTGVKVVGGTARTPLFGSNEVQTTGDIRSADVEAVTNNWRGLSPVIDFETGLDVVQVLDGDNIGYYGGPFVTDLDLSGTYPGLGVSTALQIADGTNFAPEADRRVQVGARSIGSVRMYFLAPTSIEVDEETVFTLTTDSGDLNFLPDPTLSYRRIPPMPDGEQPSDGTSTSASYSFSSASQDFIQSHIEVGDELVIKTVPISGDVIISNPVVGLVHKTLTFSVGGGPDRTVTFVRDDASLNDTEVSREGVAEQINAVAGVDIAKITAANTLEFESELDIVVRAGGTANAYILGTVADTGGSESFVTDDQNNESPHAGRCTITTIVGSTSLFVEHEGTVDGKFPASSPYLTDPTRQTFEINKKGMQRICTTAMADNAAEAGLYYFDVELVSEGSGDAWNIEASQQLTVTGYRSDGYYLTTEDENLSFSTAERPWLVVSRTVLEQGVEDDPQNATQLSGQSIQVTYDKSSMVGGVQNFASSEVERVVCSSPLSRHLIPHFVRFDVNYRGGSRESVVIPDLEKMIRNLYPMDPLESSDIQQIISGRGATSIDNPIDIIAVVHYPDRRIYIARSQDKLTTGRLAAFVPDVLNVTRVLQ